MLRRYPPLAEDIGVFLLLKLQFRKRSAAELEFQQSREAEGLIPSSLLRNLFPKLALGFIPVIILGIVFLFLLSMPS